MFPTLIESARKTNKQRVLSGSCVSLVVHAGVITGAVYGTLAAAAGDRSVKVDTAVVVLAPQQQPKPPEQQPAQLDAPLQGFQTLVVPPQIPADLPAVDLHERFDPNDYSGVGIEGGRPSCSRAPLRIPSCSGRLASTAASCFWPSSTQRVTWSPTPSRSSKPPASGSNGPSGNGP